jgi:hypothetical protein
MELLIADFRVQIWIADFGDHERKGRIDDL